jgi:hypothetical protein
MSIENAMLTAAESAAFSHAFHDPQLVPSDKMMLAGFAGLGFAG